MAKKQAVKAVRKAAAKAKTRLGNSEHHKKDSDGLTAREAQFVLHFLECDNATEAAARVGYARSGAHVYGSRMANADHIKPVIERYRVEIRKRLEEKFEISLDRTVQEIARIAYANGQKLLREDGSTKTLQELDPHTSAAVAELELSVGGHIIGKVKMHSKTRALEMLMRHQGGYKEDNKQKADAVTALLEAVSDRGPGLTVKP